MCETGGCISSAFSKTCHTKCFTSHQLFKLFRGVFNVFVSGGNVSSREDGTACVIILLQPIHRLEGISAIK